MKAHLLKTDIFINYKKKIVKTFIAARFSLFSLMIIKHLTALQPDCKRRNTLMHALLGYAHERTC